jgi:hypothetical protein
VKLFLIGLACQRVGMSLFMTLYMLYLTRDLGLSFGLAMSLNIVYMGLSIPLEVVTGWIGDRFGYRNPRWPERHGPKWLEGLHEDEFREVLLAWVSECVQSLESFESISHWQVENEPFENSWGDDGFDVRELFEQEMKVIKNTDKLHRPCIVTYGYKPWRKTFPEVLQEDIVGLDMYSKIGVKIFGRAWYLDMFQVPLMNLRLQREIEFIRKQGKSVWVTELQAEPWDVIDGALFDRSLWKKTITPDRLRRNFQFISNSEVDAVFIWGVEWWLTLDEEDKNEFVGVLKERS